MNCVGFSSAVKAEREVLPPSSGDVLSHVLKKIERAVSQICILLGLNANVPSSSQGEVSSNLHKPKNFAFLTSGAEKEIYEAADEAGIPIATHDSVYLVGKRTILGTDALRDEIKKTRKVKKSVYFAALVKFFISRGEDEKSARRHAKNVIAQFPKIGDLKSELEKEWGSAHGTMAMLRDRSSTFELQLLLNCYQYLALDFYEEPEIQVNGKGPVYRTLKAKGNLEDEVRNNKLELSEGLGIIGQLIHGFANLHAGGVVSNDPKLENMLVYVDAEGKRSVKISDWGQAKTLSEGERGFYLGNKRHMPPERLSSFKGEVFGVGMMFVRILEDRFLEKDKLMLWDPVYTDPSKKKQLRKDEDFNKKRKGIERFLATSSASPQLDVTPVDLVSHLIVSCRALFGKPEPKKRMDREIQAYLDKLEEKLFEENLGKSREITEVVGILRDMLKSDPSQRISMEEVSRRWQKIEQIQNFY